MDGHCFVSYSRSDGAEFARRLADGLVAGPPSYAVWLDVRDEQPGLDWDGQIAEAIRTCWGVLFVMTADSVQDHAGNRSEWVWALKYKKPVIPLRADASAELPFRLSSRDYIDFSSDFDIGLARLRTYLDSVGSPKWVLQELRNQLTEAERELPRADRAQRARVEHDIEDLRKRIADQEHLVADPAATRRTKLQMNHKQCALISSTVLDLPAHRQAARDACLRQDFFPIMIEPQAPGHGDLVRLSRELVEQADVYILILGYRYGEIPQGHDKSLTHLELDYVNERGIPKLVFLMADDHPVKRVDVDMGPGAERVRALREQLKREEAVTFFSSPEQLQVLLIDGLSNVQTPGQPEATSFADVRRESKNIEVEVPSIDADRYTPDFPQLPSRRD